MEVVFVTSARRDLDEVAAWWEANRTDAPGLVTADLRVAITRLEREALTLPVFRRVDGQPIRRLHLPRTHRHIYFQVDVDRVLVLAVWGSVRGILPRLRARLAEPA